MRGEATDSGGPGACGLLQYCISIPHKSTGLLDGGRHNGEPVTFHAWKASKDCRCTVQMTRRGTGAGVRQTNHGGRPPSHARSVSALLF